jgi:aromatic ring-opening dioxygenase catalytic subunit (LigB family)
MKEIKMNEQYEEDQIDIETIELSMDQAKEHIEMGEALARLHDNKDFKKVVMDGWMNDEVIRLSRLIASPAAAAEEVQTAIAQGLRSTSEFHQFMLFIGRQANMAKSSIEEYRLMLREAENAEAANDSQE